MGSIVVRPSRSVLAVVWAVLLVGAFLSPRLFPGDDPADLVTRQTARVAVLFWSIAAGVLLLDRRDAGRFAWTLGCLAYLVHVATAFEYVHGWSHAAATRHVQEATGFGPGLFVSYAFTLLWMIDVGWWWADRSTYDGRSAWIDRSIHLFMAFVVFSATVVYESGFIRWAGILLFVFLGLLAIRTRGRP